MPTPTFLASSLISLSIWKSERPYLDRFGEDRASASLVRQINSVGPCDQVVED